MNIIIFGTLWFWVVVVTVVGLIIWLLEDALNQSTDTGNGFWATIILLAFILAYYKLGSSEDVLSIVAFIRDHPFKTIGLFFGYLAGGVIWAFVKWGFHLQALKQKAKERFEDQLEYRQIPSEIHIPKVSENKYRIMSWMYYWVFSAAWTLVNEPFKKSFEFIYSKIASKFVKMAESSFGDLVKETDEVIKKKEEEKEIERNEYKIGKKQQLNS